MTDIILTEQVKSKPKICFKHPCHLVNGISITLKLNYFVFFGPCDDPADSEVERPVPLSMNIAMVAGTVMTVLIGLFPARFYALMPNATIVHPYHLGHVLEYIAIFIAGSIPFFLYIKKMKPHDEITLDFDWFYRVPLSKLVLWLSRVVEKFLRWCDIHVSGMAGYLRVHFGNPYLWTEKSSSVKVRKFSFENESRLIGDVMTAIVIVFVAMILIACALIH